MSTLIEAIEDGQDWVDAYPEISELLTTSLLWLKWVDMWNEQPYFTDDEYPFPAPAIFLEFNSESIDETGKQGEIVTMAVTVYLYYVDINDTHDGSRNQTDALRFSGYLKDIHRALKGQKGLHFSRLTRTSFAKLDTPHAGGRIYGQTYRCVVSDNSAMKSYSTDIGEDQGFTLGKGPIPAAPVDTNPVYDPSELL